MKRQIAAECAPELTEKTTLPPVYIKGFNLFRTENSYFFGSKGLTRDYLPYNSSVWELKEMPVHHQQGLFKSILYEIMVLFRHPPSKGLQLFIKS